MPTGQAALFAAILLSGCSSIRTMAVDALADAIAESGNTYAADDDIEFVGLATSFGLKTTEDLLEEAPRRVGEAHAREKSPQIRSD